MCSVWAGWWCGRQTKASLLRIQYHLHENCIEKCPPLSEISLDMKFLFFACHSWSDFFCTVQFEWLIHLPSMNWKAFKINEVLYSLFIGAGTWDSITEVGGGKKLFCFGYYMGGLGLEWYGVPWINCRTCLCQIPQNKIQKFSFSAQIG